MRNNEGSSLTPESVGTAMSRLVPGIMRGAQLDFFAGSGVTQTQFLVLGAIRSYPECSMGVLADNLHVSTPTMTGIVDRLVKAGYVIRKASPADRRQVQVSLTAKGAKVIERFQKIVQARWREMLALLSPEDLAGFSRAIGRIQRHLEGSDIHL
jgi:DNA-binding MarR family transcriptional regulator